MKTAYYLFRNRSISLLITQIYKDESDNTWVEVSNSAPDKFIVTNAVNINVFEDGNTDVIKFSIGSDPDLDQDNTSVKNFEGGITAYKVPFSKR